MAEMMLGDMLVDVGRFLWGCKLSCLGQGAQAKVACICLKVFYSLIRLNFDKLVVNFSGFMHVFK